MYTYTVVVDEHERMVVLPCVPLEFILVEGDTSIIRAYIAFYVYIIT